MAQTKLRKEQLDLNGLLSISAAEMPTHNNEKHTLMEAVFLCGFNFIDI